MTRQELKDELKYLGISQRELAERLGRSVSAVSKWGVEQSVPNYVIVYINMLKLFQAIREYTFFDAFDVSVDSWADAKPPTFCNKGHQFTDKNFIVTRNGSVRCKQCYIDLLKTRFNEGE